MNGDQTRWGLPVIFDTTPLWWALLAVCLIGLLVATFTVVIDAPPRIPAIDTFPFVAFAVGGPFSTLVLGNSPLPAVGVVVILAAAVLIGGAGAAVANSIISQMTADHE